MNIDTGHVIRPEEYEQLDKQARGRHVVVPNHLRAAAEAALAAGRSLFESKHAGQRVRSQALDLARKRKAKIRRKMVKASRRGNRR